MISLISAETYIIGGEVVTPHSEPHIVSLKSSAPGSHFCAATILSTTHALTAAHCHRRYLTGKMRKKDFSPETVWAMAGAHNIREKEESQQMTRLFKFIKHPNYNYIHMVADIATIEFNIPMTFNGFVQGMFTVKVQ